MKFPLTEDQIELLDQETDNYYLSLIHAFPESYIVVSVYPNHNELLLYIKLKSSIEAKPESLRLDL